MGGSRVFYGRNLFLQSCHAGFHLLFADVGYQVIGIIIIQTVSRSDSVIEGDNKVRLFVGYCPVGDIDFFSGFNHQLQFLLRQDDVSFLSLVKPAD